MSYEENDDNILDEEFEEISLPDEEQEDLNDIEDLDNLMKATTNKTKRVDEHQPKLSENVEVIDDFIRNFLLKNSMNKSLEIFQSEWYELKAKGTEIADDGEFRDMYRLNEALTEEMAKLRLECDGAKNVADKTKGF